MRIKILGWQYRNIRRMKDLSIDLTQNTDEVYRSSLIMMSNGTGKTTTLYLIRAIFSGSATGWRERDVRSYRPLSADVAEGKFILKVRFNEDIYYYVLHLDYEKGKAWYETSSAMMEGGYEEGRRLPVSLRDVFQKEEFISRFVFDGEQARKTLNSGSREAENAIVYLYQLDKLDLLSAVITNLINTYQEQSIGGTTARSVKVFKGKLEKREQVHLDLLRDKRELERSLVQTKEKKSEYEKKYREILAQDYRLKIAQEELLQEEKMNQNDIIHTINELMNCIKKPYDFQLDYHNRLRALAQNMQALKLPKNTAQEFFKELAESEECVCGRCIGQQERKTILEKAEEYLGEDSLVVVNSIKRALNEYNRKENCDNLEKRLKSLLKDEMEIKHGLDRLAIQMAEEGNVEILHIQEEVKQLEKQIINNEKVLERLSTDDYNTNTGLNSENNIPKAKVAWDEARDSYLKASGTYNFTKRAEFMKKYIEQVKNNALNRLKFYMVQKTNEKIEELVESDIISINKIDGHLVLEGKDGVSEGQTLAVAYAFIGTLFEHSQFKFPFIVDSPAAPADLNVRRAVARVLPQLFEQTVILVTSGEKRGFAEEFYNLENVQYLTVKGEKEQPIEIVQGRPYFEQHQEKREEEHAVLFTKKS